jgi:hypothetical protein
MVPKRLARNAALHREITATLKPAWVPAPSGILIRQSAVAIDAEKLERWTTMVVKGLIWHHWKVIAGDEYAIECLLLTDQEARRFAQLFGTKGERIERTTIGGGALSYVAVGVSGHLPISTWQWSVYGGLELAGDDPRLRTRDFFILVRTVASASTSVLITDPRHPDTL